MCFAFINLVCIQRELQMRKHLTFHPNAVTLKGKQYKTNNSVLQQLPRIVLASLNHLFLCLLQADKLSSLGSVKSEELILNLFSFKTFNLSILNYSDKLK